MENYLLDLLEYRDVLAVVATTADGLIVATAGLNGDDAEVLAASGSALAQHVVQQGERYGSVTVQGGVLHLLVGDELMLVALTDPAAPGERLVDVMDGVLTRLAQVIRDDGSAIE